MQIAKLPRAPKWLLEARTQDADVEWDGLTLIWNSGIWRGGDWHGGEFLSGTWHSGVWHGGRFGTNAVWLNGEFLGGDFEGTWHWGDFKGGHFQGVWLGGHYRGNFGEEEFSPVAWDFCESERGRGPVFHMYVPGFDWGSMHVFYVRPDGGGKNTVVCLKIGCRHFNSFAEARQHWVAREKAANSRNWRQQSLGRLDQLEEFLAAPETHKVRADRQRALAQKETTKRKAAKKATKKVVAKKAVKKAAKKVARKKAR